MEEVGSTSVLIKKFLLLGSIIKIQRGSADISLEALDTLAKKYKAFATVLELNVEAGDDKNVELEESLKTFGYQDVDLFFSPTKTSFIDLTQSEEEILSGFDEDIRKSLRMCHEKNINFKSVEKIDEFYKILHEAGHDRKFFVQNSGDWKVKWGAFGNQEKIILAFLDDKLLGGNLFLINPPSSIGLFLPITELGRHYRIAAPLIWEGLKVAKQAGCTAFDLDGLFDERYNLPKNWEGLTAFKRKFNGREVEFIKPKVKVYSKWVGALLKLGLLWVFFVEG